MDIIKIFTFIMSWFFSKQILYMTVLKKELQFNQTTVIKVIKALMDRLMKLMSFLLDNNGSLLYYKC